MDPNTKAIVDGIPESERKAVWHALGEMMHKPKGGAQTNETDDSGNTTPPPPPPGH